MTPEPTWASADDRFRLYHGDCLEVMPSLADSSVDAIVTDPPYGLSFMGKNWDHGVPGVEFWREALRVAKPGAHLAAFGGTRTYHRLACAIEDAGWEIRDGVCWLYGSGFPKSLDIGKAIDKAAGALGTQAQGFNTAGGKENYTAQDKSFRSAYGYQYVPATPSAATWDGWGTALKPAWEPITLARKPFPGTVAANVLAHGTGGLNIDGCRVGHNELPKTAIRTAPRYSGRTMANGQRGGKQTGIAGADPLGRWPANVVHDGSAEVLAGFPENAAHKGEGVSKNPWLGGGRWSDANTYADSGSAARFFYCAKADKRDRDEGNNHPTVKPTDLMAWLARLVTPPNGVILDLFAGSGSTGKAAAREGFRFIGIEKEAEYLEIAARRIRAEASAVQTDLFAGAANDA